MQHHTMSGTRFELEFVLLQACLFPSHIIFTSAAHKFRVVTSIQYEYFSCKEVKCVKTLRCQHRVYDTALAVVRKEKIF